MRSRLLIEYDGGGFSGWARQPERRTVQAELERALAVALRLSGVQLTVAGRTDAGVHALGQVASYEGSPAAVSSLNALLPDDVSVLSCEEADPGFDARRDATSRAYRYCVLAQAARSALAHRYAWHWPYPVDVERLHECASALVGTHDFTAFTPTETYHERFQRDVFSALWREGAGASGVARGRSSCWPDVPLARTDGLLEFWIEADAFMRQMNRILVGTMLEVAARRRSVSEFRALLEGAPRSAAGRTAPPHGLYLMGVGYEGVRVLG